jgi:hypothetical protein
MRFTKIQAALFKNGISFVHMAPTVERKEKALDDFIAEINRTGTYYTQVYDRVTRQDARARFMLCVSNGAASEHVAVMFVDGKRDEFPDKRAYDEARYIPAEVDGAGPMVIR